MHKIYFKQAIQMLKQNKFISIIAISGTALAIMMIMTILLSEEVKTISVAPEINRDRTYYISHTAKYTTGNQQMEGGYLSQESIQQYIADLKTPEYVSAVNAIDEKTSTLVNKEGSTEYINTVVRLTDANYWKIMSFHFLEGKPFAQEEFESGIPVAVINQRMEQQLFKGEKALGQTITVEFEPYRVIGIVSNVSPVFTMAYGDVWIPYTSQQTTKSQSGYLALLLARSNEDYPAIYEEVRKVEQAYHTRNNPESLYLRGPESHRVYRMDIRAGNPASLANSIKAQDMKTVFILCILLIVPAINLSGFSLSRIKKRTAEIGVRKAFGAKKHIILIQVLCENLITSLIGGVIGLVLSYAAVYLMRDWLLGIEDSLIPISTLFSLPVFLAVFIACLLINLLSAGIPAWRASRMNIIDSLNQNDKQA